MDAKASMQTGFNQAWFKNDYGQQWLDHSYDPVEVDHMLTLLKNSGGNILRVWLFEGYTTSAIEWNKEGRPVALRPEFTKNLKDFLFRAKAHGVQAYLTLLSSTLQFEGSEHIRRPYWYKMLNNHDGFRDEFKRVVLAPLLDTLVLPEFKGVIYGIDLVNEIDLYVMENMFEREWYGTNEFICDFRNEIQARATIAQSPLPVTASIGWPWIPFRSRGAINILLDPNPHPSCVDFWDVHLYNNLGEVPRCEEVRALAKNFNKKIILGEFGQWQLFRAFDDEVQTQLTKNFLNNARDCGLSAALAWRLKDERPGHNPEARFSYFHNGQTRPAYQEFVTFRAENPLPLETPLFTLDKTDSNSLSGIRTRKP